MSVQILPVACYRGQTLACRWVGLGSRGFVLVDGTHINIFILNLECRGLAGGAGAR